MIIPSILCWILLVWGVRDGDLNPKEAGVFGILSVLLVLGLLLAPALGLWLVAPTVLIDIVLIMKVLGGDVQIY